uniref:Uridine diphosphate glucose pyrophosphatase NUDT14 n=1 Tax=Lygus hesperus TaxID=30085 RepID=A0A0A9WPK9_LYGHE
MRSSIFRLYRGDKLVRNTSGTLHCHHIKHRIPFRSAFMDSISNVTVKPLERGSKFVIPVRVNYTQDDKRKTWEAVRAGRSVSCVIFNTSRQKLVCVRQFRPGVFIHGAGGEVWTKDDEAEIDTKLYPPSLGVTLEFCGGIVDKPSKTLEEICAEEILEETGYSVCASALTKIGTCYCAVGIAGDPQTLYYVEVTDEMRTAPGGGIDDEMIEIVEFSVEETRKMLSEDKTIAPPEFFWGLTWFLLNKVSA